MQTPDPSGPSTFWEQRYRGAEIEEVSWYEKAPNLSLALLRMGGVEGVDGVIDVGGGASFLAQSLQEEGFGDLTVLDASGSALEIARSRWAGSSSVEWIVADLLQWSPTRRWRFWHDRAVFHFLTDGTDRATYRNLLAASLGDEGIAVIATFAEDGPTMCSGLEVARYRPEELAAVFDRDFSSLAFGRYLHLTPSGVVQPLSWVVLRRR